MTEGPSRTTRLRFYGLSDYATFFQIERASELLDSFNPDRTDYDVNEVVELHHAVQFFEHGLLTREDDEHQASFHASLPGIRRAIGRFFSTINDDNVADRVVDVDYQFRGDVLDLLARNRTFHRCTPEVLIPTLQSAHFHLADMLSNAEFIRAYGDDVRALILSSPENAELVIAKHVQDDPRRAINLPSCLTPEDKRGLIERYIDSPSSNPNYLQLVASARVDRGAGINAQLKLKAQRAYDAYWAKHFETNEGIRTGAEVRIVEDQEEAVVATLDGMMATFNYSQTWLSNNLDFPTILNNFIFVFEWSNAHMLLNFPSFYAQLGVFERFIVTSGKESYRTGAAFNHTNQAALLQAIMYEHYLRSQEVKLEDVLAWFFNVYLREEFGAENFKFRPSSPTATFLEKCRHLFAEMESVLKQFSLYIENGDLDPELLAMTSESLSYASIPSLVDDKYITFTDNADAQRVKHLLFSDQATMGYIGEDLSETNFADLILKHEVPYETFEDYQRDDLDFLEAQGIVSHDADGPVKFADSAQYRVLKCLNDFEAANVNRYPASARGVIQDLVDMGWVETSSTLFTRAESSYYNYMLNQSEFSNGPDLRNRYLHGSQADGEDARVHFHTYMEALRLLIAVVLKINDDFEMASMQTPDS